MAAAAVAVEWGGGEGEWGWGQSNGPFSVSHKLGSEKCHGTPSEDEQREGGGGGVEAAVGCFSPTSSQAHMCFRPLSMVLSLGLSLAYVLLFFFFFFFCWSLKEECLGDG